MKDEREEWQKNKGWKTERQKDRKIEMERLKKKIWRGENLS